MLTFVHPANSHSTNMSSLDGKDVAFSLLHQDLDLAKALLVELPETIEAFLYSEQQKELIAARDGVDAFSTVFRTAKLCVVLYRVAWGQTRWTRLESNVIKDRFLDVGSDFLVLCRLDDSPLPAWFPTTDLWIDLRAEPTKSAAAYIAARLQNRHLGKPRRPVARRPVPIARYHQSRGFSTSERIPWELEMCDACGELIQYRPMIRVGLAQDGSWPAVSESLCPRCARARGFTPNSRNSLTDEQLYADRNPLFLFHAFGRLSALISHFRNDTALRALGMDNMAVMRAAHASVLVYGERFPKAGLRIPIRERDVKEAGVKDDKTFREYVRSSILEALQFA